MPRILFGDPDRANLTANAHGNAASAAPQPPEVSIVVPVHNEEAVLEVFFRRLLATLKAAGVGYEIICVNDGSTDGSLTFLLRMNEENPAIKVVNLSRNFGKDVAISAGFDYARGAAVIPIDADLQDPPELIQPMLAKWREGYDVVYATRRRAWAIRGSSAPLHAPSTGYSIASPMFPFRTIPAIFACSIGEWPMSSCACPNALAL